MTTRHGDLRAVVERHADRLQQTPDIQIARPTSSTTKENSVTISFDPSSVGHDGRCDLDAGCTTPAAWAVAEACSPELLTGASALAFYCDQHIAAAPVACFDAVEWASKSFTGDLWPALVASYPNPLPVANESLPTVGV
jgi:hypothetical protein